MYFAFHGRIEIGDGHSVLCCARYCSDSLLYQVRHISTNTLLTEGDYDAGGPFRSNTKFQPTPSSRRVTRLLAVSAVGAAAFQPTPSSRRVTAILDGEKFEIWISTNTLLAEGDGSGSLQSGALQKFQPTPSSRRVTVKVGNSRLYLDISTNTLLAEGDPAHHRQTWPSDYFNQHPPRGG